MKSRIAGCGWNSLSSGTFLRPWCYHTAVVRSPWRSWKFFNKQQWKWPSLDGRKLFSWAPQLIRHNSSVIKGIINTLLSLSGKVILWPLDQCFFFLHLTDFYISRYFCISVSHSFTQEMNIMWCDSQSMRRPHISSRCRPDKSNE